MQYNTTSYQRTVIGGRRGGREREKERESQSDATQVILTLLGKVVQKRHFT